MATVMKRGIAVLAAIALACALSLITSQQAFAFDFDVQEEHPSNLQYRQTDEATDSDAADKGGYGTMALEPMDITYTVTFNGNGIIPGYILVLQVPEDSTVRDMLDADPDLWDVLWPSPIVKGDKTYKVDDYYTDQIGMDWYDFDTPVTTDVALYACWYQSAGTIDNLEFYVNQPRCGTVVTYSGGEPFDWEQQSPHPNAYSYGYGYDVDVWQYDKSKDDTAHPFTGTIVGGKQYAVEFSYACEDGFTVAPDAGITVHNGKLVEFVQGTDWRGRVVVLVTAKHDWDPWQQVDGKWEHTCYGCGLTVTRPSLDLSKAKITLVPSTDVYTGEFAYGPDDIKVTVNGYELEPYVDYSITWLEDKSTSNGLEVGNIIFSFEGYESAGVTGTKTATYRIEHLDYSKYPDLTIGKGWWLSEGGQFKGWETFYLDYAIVHGLMSGYKDEKTGKITGFGPEDSLNRAQAAVVIYRMATGDLDNGKNIKNENPNLKDVPDGAYYTKAVNWCVANGVITGYEKNGKAYAFGPNDQVTREQIATMIARYVAGGKDALAGYSTASAKKYKDAKSIGNWALEGVAYCYDKGIMTGNPDKTFAPGDPTIRAAMAKIASIVDKGI